MTSVQVKFGQSPRDYLGIRRLVEASGGGTISIWEVSSWQRSGTNTGAFLLHFYREATAVSVAAALERFFQGTDHTVVLPASE